MWFLCRTKTDGNPSLRPFRSGNSRTTILRVADASQGASIPNAAQNRGRSDQKVSGRSKCSVKRVHQRHHFGTVNARERKDLCSRRDGGFRHSWRLISQEMCPKGINAALRLENIVRTSRWVLALFALAVMSGHAAMSDTTSDRYTMSPTDDGFVRLDKQTGAMAQCTRNDGVWACKPMADSQRKLQDEMDKLRAENKSLRKQVDDLEETLGIGPGPSDDDGPTTKFALPSEDDVDQAFDYLEGMLGKLRERMEKLEKQHNKRGEGTPL